MNSKPHSGSWLTTLRSPHMQHISQLEQLPRWSESRFCTSLTRSLACLRACYLACGIVASLTRPLNRLKVALESSQTR